MREARCSALEACPPACFNTFMSQPISLYIDADACPVKDEVYRVAERHLQKGVSLKVFVVANSFINTPRVDYIERVIVPGGMDVADDWIAERAKRGDIVITADIPLAARAVKAGADAIAPNGKPFTKDNIGATLATRNLMTDLRSAGAVTSGPRPFSPRDRSQFLAALDLADRAAFARGIWQGLNFTAAPSHHRYLLLPTLVSAPPLAQDSSLRSQAGRLFMGLLEDLLGGALGGTQQGNAPAQQQGQGGMSPVMLALMALMAYRAMSGNSAPLQQRGAPGRTGRVGQSARRPAWQRARRWPDGRCTRRWNGWWPW